jgi:hypothetical protein
VGANTIFSLCAAAASLLVSVLSAVKGQLPVAIVFGMLVVGFLVRAGEGRREAERVARETVEEKPSPPRRVKPARFKRR